MNVKFKIGTKASLDAKKASGELIAGAMYLCKDTGELYVCNNKGTDEAPILELILIDATDNLKSFDVTGDEWITGGGTVDINNKTIVLSHKDPGVPTSSGSGSFITGITTSKGHVTGLTKGGISGGGTAANGQFVKSVTASGDKITVTFGDLASISVGNAAVADKALSANKVANSLIVKQGATEVLSYDGSSAKTLNLPENATQSASGLMSSTDKSKLDGIDDNANNYSHPTHTSHGSGLYKVTVDGLGHVTGATAVTKSDITSLGIPGQDTVYSLPVASEGAIGGVKSGTDITVDGSGNVTVKDNSHNHLISNVNGLQTALDGKAAASHTHAISEVTDLQDTLDTINTKAPLASPALTGTPTAPTAKVNTSSKQIATTEFVVSEINNKIAAADAMIYKGTIGTGGTEAALPSTTAKTGWTYKVITAGTYAGQACEVGDMIVCLTDGSSSTAATWTVIQANVDGAVTGPASSTDGQIAVFSGTTGKVIKAINSSDISVGTASKTAKSLKLTVGTKSKTFDGSSAVEANLSSKSITIPVPKVYEKSTSTNSTSIPATTHGCGDKPIIQCYENGAVVVCAITVDGSGNITVEFNGTHTITIRVLGMGTQTLNDFITLS